MKRVFLSLLIALIAVAGANAQLLYKISGKELKSPSYIVGTYHLAPESFVDSIPGARAVLEAVDVVCGEVVMNEMESPENTKKVEAAMMLPDSQTLSDIFSPEEMEQLNAFMKRNLGVDFTNPLIKKTMGSMTPVAISTQLQLVQYMKLTPGFNPNKLIDSYFQKTAQKAGKQIAGLETVDFQIATLYQGSTLERQKQQLMCMIENEDFYNMVMKDIAAAYFAQDINAILEVSEAKLNNSCDSTPEEDEALIYGRNSKWAEVIPSMIAEKATLFVVGAAHLPGERGVLELLEQKGYTVEVVE